MTEGAMGEAAITVRKSAWGGRDRAWSAGFAAARFAAVRFAAVRFAVVPVAVAPFVAGACSGVSGDGLGALESPVSATELSVGVAHQALRVPSSPGSQRACAQARRDLFLLVESPDSLPTDALVNARDTLDIDLADVDGDGDLDAFLAEGSGGAVAFQNQLWMNDGTGKFTDETSRRLPAVENQSTEVDFADIDADGDLDAVVANAGANQLLLNDGSGHFADVSARVPQALPPGPPGFAVPFPPFFLEVSAEARLLDVSLDGFPDLLIANENPLPFGPPGDQNRLLINDGHGSFVDETMGRLPQRIDNTSGIAAGDIDGDGDRDLIVLNQGQNFVYVNAEGVFRDETSARLPPLVDASRKGVLADVDSDGDLDLVVGNSRRQQDRLYLNDGQGVFVDVTSEALPVDASTTTDVDLADFNGDGALDLFVTNVGDFVSGHGFLGEPNRLLLGDGHGHFIDASFPRLELLSDRSTNAEVGDVDGDGWLDVLVANSGGIDQLGLPPPDGRERLLLNRPCWKYRELCIETLLGRLVAELTPLVAPAGGAPAAQPGGDFAARRQLRAWLAALPRAERAASLEEALGRLRERADGAPNPPDWVTAPRASSVAGYVDFLLQVLRLGEGRSAATCSKGSEHSR